MKKLFLILLIAVMTVTLCACGDKTCPSCGKSVGSLKTDTDWAGARHTWCSKCWSEYWDIIGDLR